MESIFRGGFYFLLWCSSVVWITVPTAAIEDGSWSRLSFVLEPEDTTVKKHSPAWLHCVVQGDPQPTLTWRKDNTPLVLTKDFRRRILPNGTLAINAVTYPRSERSDEGNYQCVASSPGVGTIISTKARLSVAGLPKFADQPSEELEVYEGERARFPCSINSNPPAEITWYRNSHALSLEPRMTKLPSGALEIENVQVSDEGQYYCHATNLDKTKVSQKANLVVKLALALRPPTPPTFIARPKSVLAKLGENVTLDCAANGYPEPQITWLKDGTSLDMQNLDSRFLFIAPTKTLLVTKLQESDGGNYMCRAENRVDSKDAVAHVQVQVAPRFLKKPKDSIAYEKEDIELQCKVYAQPSARVYWMKNGELIIESEYFQIVNGNNLKILGLVEADKGIYQCFASNSAGHIQATAQLIVHKAGMKAVMFPDISTDIVSEAPAPLTPTRSPNNKKEGRRKGNKNSGKSSETATPSAPQHLQAIISTNRYVTLSWHEPEYNNDHIIGYSVYYRQEGSHRERVQNVSASSSVDGLDEYKTQIGQLSSGSSYLVRVVAHTVGGVMGESTEDLLVHTRPDLDLPGPPQELVVIPVSPTSLNVSWSPPPPSKTPVTHYVMYYMQVGSADEHDFDVKEMSHQLTGLEEYMEYSVWLVAVNANGQGDPTHEVTARTFSDVPSKQPQNVTIEPASSTSLVVRWEPPPPEHQNGIITGYKIKYKEKGIQGSSTKTTDGNWRLYAVSDLNKGKQYSLKISAMTVNGSGPATSWISAETLSNDLDENKVPDIPMNLRVIPFSDSVHVKWEPPLSQEVMVRGYTIGWGRGIPDVYFKTVDSKQRDFEIDKLKSNTEYVISLRAYNSVGDGEPAYEQVRTKVPVEVPVPTLTPPIGLTAEVLTPFTVALSWTDTTLSRNQYKSDDSHYTARYTTYSSASSSSPRYRYENASDVTCLIDNLKPATMYEFSVMAVKGRRKSEWSLVTSITTKEARPSSPPRDVTVVTIIDEPSKVIFNWQPPKQSNGIIIGYLLFYTTDASNWAMEKVLGNRMTCSLHDLTPNTLYHYKMQARNNKGFGPFSPVGNFTTLPAARSAPVQNSGLFVNNGSLIAIVVTAVFVVVVVFIVLLGICYYCKRIKPPPRVNNLNSQTTKSNKVELKPPDLWIHHDHLELKNFDKNDRSASPNQTTIINHNGPEYEPDDKNTTYTSTSTLDRRTPYQSTYLRDQLSDDETDKLLNRRSFKPKPLIISLDVNKDCSVVGGSTSSSVYSDGTLGRPGYSLPQFSNASSQGYNSPSENPYSSNPTSAGGMLGGSSYDPLSSLPPASQPLLGGLSGPPASSGQYSSLGSSGEGSNTLGKRSANPLRSFSVPGPPQSAPTTPQPKHIVAVHPQGSTSPFKKALNVPHPSGANVPGARRVLPTSLPEQEEMNDALIHGYSTEELSQEMANLEGLMKDLSAITANQFNC